MRVGIIGLGEIGGANHLYLSKRHQVYHYDPALVEFDMPICDIYLICTPSDKVIDAIIWVTNRDEAALISIESTIKVGTCKKARRYTLQGIIHCPQRYWKDDPHRRGVRRIRLLGATDEAALSIGYQIYTNEFNMHMIPVRPVEVAEFAKAAENAYRGVQIATAGEIKLKCDDLGLDYALVREAIMTATPMHWLAEVREGIGGHCLPMAMEWLQDLSIVKAAKESNERFRE